MIANLLIFQTGAITKARKMDLNLVKSQIEEMLKSISLLGASDKTEALDFLKDCALDFGLIIPEGKLVSTEEKISPITDISTYNAPSSFLEKNTSEELEFEDSNSQKNQALSELENSENDKDVPENKLENFSGNEKEKKIKPITTQWKEYSTLKPLASKSAEFSKDATIVANSEKVDRLDALEEISKKVREVCFPNEELPKEKKIPTNKDALDNGEILKCPGCRISFETKALLHQHFTTHGKTPLSCRMCRSNFSHMLHFWRHQKKKECHLSLLKCSECGEKFKYRRHYLKHVLGHNDNNCRYCDEKFSTWVLYKQHLKEKHPDVKMERDLIPCKFCSMSFRRHLSLYNHYQTEHSKGKFVCLSCGLLLPTKEKFKEHALVHESEKIWKCKICKMKFYRRQQLLFHISVHNSGTYKCLTCDITVTSKATLNKHKKQGHEVRGLEPKFECEICHKTFKKRVVLNNHMATHSKDRKYYCKSCVKSFRTLDALQKHQKRKSHFEKAKIVLPESKYEKVYEDKLICESCGKQYKTQRELTWHRRVHKNTYPCEVCGKTFTLKVNLTKHTRLHKNKICVVCELCGNTFNQLSALNEHMLMKHSDVRKAECEICKKKFKRKSELNRHMRIHEQKRPFACFCGTAFKQSGHLQTHYKTFHQNKSLPPEQNTLVPAESFPNPTGEVYTEAMVNDQKQMFVNEDQNTLLTLENLDVNYRNSNSFQPIQVSDNMEGSSYGLRYTQPGIDPINVNYDELDFEASQAEKQELVFTSPAIDLSMVTIPEVVGNDISLGGPRDHGEALEGFNKLPDDESNLQLVNLSEHIVQEYLLNLP